MNPDFPRYYGDQDMRSDEHDAITLARAVSDDTIKLLQGQMNDALNEGDDDKALKLSEVITKRLEVRKLYHKAHNLLNAF